MGVSARNPLVGRVANGVLREPVTGAVRRIAAADIPSLRPFPRCKLGRVIGYCSGPIRRTMSDIGTELESHVA